MAHHEASRTPRSGTFSDQMHTPPDQQAQVLKQRNTIAAHLEDNAQGRPPTQVFCGSEAGDH